MKTIGLLLCLLVGITYGQSCVGRCGDSNLSASCRCDASCRQYGDCCPDFEDSCLTCRQQCGQQYLKTKPCQCNSKCGRYGNCCQDYDPLCTGNEACNAKPKPTKPPPTKAPEVPIEDIIESETVSSSSRGVSGGSPRGNTRPRGSSTSSSTRGSISNSEIKTLTEELLRVDRGGKSISINTQGRSSSSKTADNAPAPLIGTVPNEVLNWETTKLMKKLLDNYVPDASQKEVVDSTEQREEDEFLNALVKTEVMKKLEDFLKRKGYLTGTLRAKLKEIWFTLYKRAGRLLGSSGFEHVFIGELKGGKVSGFHNWLNFMKEEQEGDLNYKGYMKVIDLNGKGEVIKLRFDWMDLDKPSGSVFVGTTPELEMAVYTLCFLAKPDSKCWVNMAGKNFFIQTWKFTAPRGVTVIGSAYPSI